MLRDQVSGQDKALPISKKKYGSAEKLLTRSQSTVFGIFLGLVGAGVVGYSLPGLNSLLTTIIGLVAGINFVTFIFKGVLSVYSLFTAKSALKSEDTYYLEDELPLWSILVPLYNEEKAVKSLITSISALDWPKEKLEVLLLLREEDNITFRHFDEKNLPNHFRVIRFGLHYPKTKPYALNVGLKHVKGEYLVIYDAESRPQPDQIRKAYDAFKKQRVGAVQAPTLCRNASSLITKFYASEYAFYHPYVIPGLSRLGAPVPLPGNSMHFKTEIIKRVDGWDPFNMAEDCNLGACLAREGIKVVAIDSYTLEEGPVYLGQWIKQRTRWNMGFMQTWLTHMQDPVSLYRDLGLVNFVYFQLVFGASSLILLANPIFWGLTGAYMLTGSPFIQQLFPGPVLYMGSSTLIVGSIIQIVLAQLGSMSTGYAGHVKWMLLSPIYWILHSYSAWRAVYKLVTTPHKWEQTEHGIVSETEVQNEIPV